MIKRVNSITQPHDSLSTDDLSPMVARFDRATMREWRRFTADRLRLKALAWYGSGVEATKELGLLMLTYLGDKP